MTHNLFETILITTITSEVNAYNKTKTGWIQRPACFCFMSVFLNSN